MVLRRSILSDCVPVPRFVQAATVCIFMLAASLNCSAQSDSRSRVLPGFDYWSLTFEIVSNPRIAEALEISPAQIKAIANLRSSDYMREAFRKKSQEITLRWARDRKSTPPPLEGTLERGILESDDVVKVELSKILEEKQVTMLRTVAMRQKYKFGFSPFYDSRVAEFCNVSRVDQRKLAGLVETEKERFEKKLKNAQFELGSDVVASLPAESQKRFACYVGDSYLPGFKLPSDFDFESVPHCKDAVLALGALQTICESRALRSTLGLTEQQAKRLLDANEERENALIASRADDHRHYLQIWLKTSENCTKVLRNTLTPAQALAVCQSGSLREFNSAFEVPFTRREVIEYLQLTDEEARAVRVVAKEKHAEFQEVLAKLNRATFDLICNTLPKSERETFSTLFADVY